MVATTLPQGMHIQQLPCAPASLQKALREACDQAHDFTGFITFASDDSLYLLFFFKSRPYAAGAVAGGQPSPLSIHECLGLISRRLNTPYELSVTASDPVLLKSLLIYIQDPPTAKAPSSLINLEAVLDQIRQEAADALIILQKRQMLNFFFFKNGVRGMSYYADREFHQDPSVSIDEQMLIYAFQGGSDPVEAQVYRTLVTRETTESITLEEMLALVAEKKQGETGGAASEPEELPAADLIEDDLVLAVLEGPQKGETLSSSIPCIIGRKDADITLADPMVSKQHAALQVVNGRLLLMDLNSTNGTVVNGQKVRQHPLQEGDLILMGSSTFKVLRCTLP